MKNTEDRETYKLVQNFWTALEKINVAMLVTKCDQGMLRSRPMFTQKIELPNIIWFATKVEDQKNSEILKHQNVNLSYSEPSSKTFLSISGIATVEIDPSVIEKVLSGAKNEWLNQGVERSHVSLIKVEVQLAEYWDSETGIMNYFKDFLEIDKRESDYQTGNSLSDVHEKIQFQLSF